MSVIVPTAQWANLRLDCDAATRLISELAGRAGRGPSTSPNCNGRNTLTKETQLPHAHMSDARRRVCGRSRRAEPAPGPR